MLHRLDVIFISLAFGLAVTAHAQANQAESKPSASDGIVGQFGSLNFGLGSLPLLSGAETRSISAENPTGSKGKGAMTIPIPGDPNQPYSFLTAHLGRGWKTQPFLAPKAHQAVTLMDVDGPGVIEHIWMVPADPSFLYHGRACVLRFYWDGEPTPSAEVPITDFFAIGHDIFAPVNSLPIVVNYASALNSFWPMPFRKHARITFSNDSDRDETLLAYQITYALGPVPANAAYFHAQWRHGSWATQNPYVILDGVKGDGRYVGTFLAVNQMDDMWYGEGEVQFYLDGDAEFPTISGTGTEDYFLCSYGFPRIRSTLYSGITLKDGVIGNDPGGNAGAKWSMYRWHIMDPVNFHQDLRITIQGLGGMKGQKGFSKRLDDLTSVAYWYQTEPHAPFPALPAAAERAQDVQERLPISIFDLRKARVWDGRNKLRFAWRDPATHDTDFQKVYYGFDAAQDTNVYVSRGVASEVDRQRRGFLLQGDSPGDPVSVEWAVSVPAGGKLDLSYALAIVPTSKQGARFSVTAMRRDGQRQELLNEILVQANRVHRRTLELPSGVVKIQFTAEKMGDGKPQAVWFHPEVE